MEALYTLNSPPVVSFITITIETEGALSGGPRGSKRLRDV